MRCDCRTLFVLAAAVLAGPSSAATPMEDGFADWLAVLRQEARAHGISEKTLNIALDNLRPLPQVIVLDRQQPEFTQTFAQYLKLRVHERSIATGRQQLEQQRELLEMVEQRYGVPAPVLVALWGLETSYGRNLGDYSVLAALATLAYDSRRSPFFYTQLLDALHILDAGHVAVDAMLGSWAGAMGHMQFLPATFRAFAVDGDGDNSIDVWDSLDDAMHSAGNYLKHAGWRRDTPVAIEVVLPDDFDWQLANLNLRHPVAWWRALGVSAASEAELPAANLPAAILLPQGWRGVAFMVFDNFYVLMQWNRSIHYALAVAHLATRIAGGPPLAGLLQDEGGLDRAQVEQLQRALHSFGFDVGEVDGILGSRTEAAIRSYQRNHQLPVDGYASHDLFEHVARQWQQSVSAP